MSIPLNFNPLGFASIADQSADYLPALFLKSTGTQYIKTDIPANGDLCALCNYEITTSGCVFGSRKGGDTINPHDAYYVHFSASQGKTFGYQYIYPYLGSFETNKKSFFKATYSLEIDGQVIVEKEKLDFSGLPLFVFSCNMKGGQALPFIGKIYDLSIEDKTHKVIFVAALDKQGAPCLFDKISNQPFYNSGTGAFIVGMTAAQARALSQLPADAPTKTLTVSLPAEIVDGEGNVTDSAVDAAINTAKNNGWTITIQTYTES